jgi:hypothetical protein
MRKLTSIFLILVFTLPFWVKGVVLLNFMANRTYIVEHFCENKDKPQLHCEGKCYLHKELKKSEPSEGDTQTPLLRVGSKNGNLLILTSQANWLKYLPVSEVPKVHFCQTWILCGKATRTYPMSRRTVMDRLDWAQHRPDFLHCSSFNFNDHAHKNIRRLDNSPSPFRYS